MQKDQSTDNSDKTYCRSCNRYILTSNFLLHEGRCQRMSQIKSSTISQNNQQQKHQLQNENQQIQLQPSLIATHSYPNLSVKREIGSFKKKSEDKDKDRQQSQDRRHQNEERVPCPFCGYMQSLIQLDTHPNQCQHRQIECNFCCIKFPNSLMEDHMQICSQNPMNVQRNMQRSRRNQMRRNEQQMDEQEEQMVPMFFQQRNRNMYRPSNLMDLLGPLLFGQRGQGPNRQNPNWQDPNRHQQNINRQQNPSPNFQFIQFSSNQNGEPHRVMFRSNSNSSNPVTFIQLIQMLARRENPNQNPGLNKQQLRRLAKIKYHKKNQEPDLCTICYCEFQQNEQVIQLKCKHIFHQQCIFEWLKRVSTCPVCKMKLKEGPAQQQIQEFQELPNQSEDRNHQHRGSSNSRQQQGNSRSFLNFFGL